MDRIAMVLGLAVATALFAFAFWEGGSLVLRAVAFLVGLVLWMGNLAWGFSQSTDDGLG